MKITPLVTRVCLAMIVFTAQAQAEEKFKVCADPLNPPYSTQKQDGFENKIAELFAKKLGQTLEYTWFAQRIGFIRNTLTAPVNDADVDSKNFKCDVVIGVPDGYDLTLNTKPYYQSTYVLLIAKGRGYDEIKDAAQLAALPLPEQEKLKIAMFDKGPGTTWLQKHGLLDQGISYQSMSGDNENNVAMQIDKDLKAKKIDMVILWGPMAAYVASQSPENSYALIPMQSTPELKFAFAMAMGVRKPDKDRKEILDKLITDNAAEIQAIIESYHIPLVPLTKQ
jgi:quinoprotein dehydrogenase-associated probable ABC transporter substrate-binding protein